MGFRPEVKEAEIYGRDLLFQVIDIQCRVRNGTEHSRRVKPLSFVEKMTNPYENALYASTVQYDEHDDREKCVIILFGTTEAGHSIAVLCDFRPFFFMQIPDGFGRSNIRAVKNDLARVTSADANLITCEVTKRTHVCGWEPDMENLPNAKQHNYLKISFPSIKAMKIANGNVRKRIKKHGAYKPAGLKTRVVFKPKCWEAYIDVVHKFEDEYDIRPGGWVRLRAGTYSKQAPRRISLCQIEVQTECKRIESVPEKNDVAPFVLASFDAEMYSKSRAFPSADNADDYVIGIGVTIQVYGRDEHKKFYFGLKDHAPTEEGTIFSYETERLLLLKFRDFVFVHVDPDIVVGYNIFGFDYKYLFDRIERYQLTLRFNFWGRLFEETKPEEHVFSSSAYGDNKDYHVRMSGRLPVDLYVYIKRAFNLRKYTLSAVSQHFLKDDKVDLKYRDMFKAWEEGPEGRRKVAEYCIQDTVLPLLLMDHMMTILNTLQLAYVTYTLPYDILHGGQQKRVFNLFVKKAHMRNFVMDDYEDSKVARYAGATVIEPKLGFYTDPVATLDFASLYPSIMIDNNISHDTLVVDEAFLDLPGVEYNRIRVSDTITDVFVRQPEGLLCQIEKDLLTERRAVKKQMKQCTGLKRAMLNAKQLALKVTCNSAYGFCGAENGIKPCLAAARSVTARGRDMLQKTKAMIEEKYGDSVDVIYGDTDSVMIHYRGKTLREVFEIGPRDAEYVTSAFGDAIELEFEKAYLPYLLLKKKRYAGVKYESCDEKGKTDVKGIELVRRDVCLFTQKVYKDALNALLYDHSVEKARKTVFDNMCDLEDEKVPLEQFELSAQLKAGYKNDNLAQVQVRNKIRERTPGAEPKPGDRVSFYICDVGKSNDPVYMKAEDPEYVKENNIPIDYLHYIEKQIEKPITALFSNFTSMPSLLFTPHKQALKRKKARMKSLVARKMVPLPPPKSDSDNKKPERKMKQLQFEKKGSNAKRKRPTTVVKTIEKKKAVKRKTLSYVTSSNLKVPPSM